MEIRTEGDLPSSLALFSAVVKSRSPVWYELICRGPVLTVFFRRSLERCTDWIHTPDVQLDAVCRRNDYSSLERWNYTIYALPSATRCEVVI